MLEGDEEDVEKSFSRIATALSSLPSPVSVDVRLLDGESVDVWALEASQSASQARRAEPDEPDIRVVLKQETWVSIAQGRLSPYDALFDGKLRVGGDLDLAKRVVEHLSDRSVPYVPPC